MIKESIPVSRIRECLARLRLKDRMVVTLTAADQSRMVEDHLQRRHTRHGEPIGKQEAAKWVSRRSKYVKGWVQEGMGVP